MSRGSKMHPADRHTAQEILRATQFSVHFRKGPFERYDRTANSLGEARAIEKELNMAHGQHGRRAAVYAITPEGAAYFVPDSFA